MLVPLTEEEEMTLLPQWARELREQGCPIAVGLPVYDVLYGPKYGKPRGIVLSFEKCDDSCTIRRDHALVGHAFVELIDLSGRKSGTSACLANYWVPDCDTEEGRAFVKAWRESQRNNK